MPVQDEKKVNLKRLLAIVVAGILSVYTIATLQGPHGIGALQAMLAKVKSLQAQNADLARMTAEKRNRVTSLERGQNVDMEMRRFGRTRPDEVEYKVTEPDVEAPAEDLLVAPN